MNLPYISAVFGTWDALSGSVVNADDTHLTPVFHLIRNYII
jgi:hypothetical protein